MHADRAAARRVLVVEDDELLRESLVEVLVEGGWAVDHARDGVEGLERLRARQPDVILLDQRMPRMTGEELVMALRKAGIRVPVVLMSATALVEGLAARLAVPFYLEKPFGMPQLFGVLDAAVRSGG